MNFGKAIAREANKGDQSLYADFEFWFSQRVLEFEFY